MLALLGVITLGIGLISLREVTIQTRKTELTKAKFLILYMGTLIGLKTILAAFFGIIGGLLMLLAFFGKF